MNAIIEITADLLRSRPLPVHRPGDDKESRGRVLVVGGGVETPGAALLAGLGALRAGAGKVQIGTVASVAPALAVAFPEARVFALPETPRGGLDPAAEAMLRPRTGDCAALVLGPGMLDPEATAALTARLLDCEAPALLIDAGALKGLWDHRDALARRGSRAVLTPHAGEMASCLGMEIEAVQADPVGVARCAARAFNAVVALKGGCTRIATPEGEAWSCAHGNVGLATAGSGDVLAGLIGGLLARGADPLTAAMWGVWMHGEAGERLARSRGPLGYLARELPGEVPALMGELSRPPG